MKSYQWMVLSLLIPALLLAGCTPLKGPRIEDTLAAPDFVGVPSKTPLPSPAPDEVTAASNSAINQGLFSLALNNVELKEALAILSKDSPIPIVPESGVSGRVTINLKNKPLGDLLFTMLRPLGYSAKVEDNMIVVGPAKMVTQSFVVNYLKDKRTSSSTTNASISASSGNSSRSSSDSGSSSSSSITSGGNGNVTVTTFGGSDFWGEIIKGIESITYGPDKKAAGNSGVNIVTNQLAGIIQVTAPAKTMEIVSSYLLSIEQEIRRQVLIQAHIVEIELNDEFSLGIDWKTFLDKAHKFSISQNLTPTNLSNVFVLDINTSDFTLLLDTFKEQGGINMLSSPKISTLNNQKAVIKLTTNEVTWVQSVLRGNINSPTDIVINTPQIDEVGLFLDVTPNIAASGRISMQVHPSITEVKEVSQSPDGKSSKPVITVREIDTMVDVQSGQTMVIGGLISDKISNVKRGIPILGDIPFLGWLFSNHSQIKRKTELVIFLTPYILSSDVIEAVRTEHENRLWGSKGINQYVNRLMEQ